MNKKVIEKIASKTGYSVTHISNVIAGRRNNEQISKLYSKYTTPKVKKTSKKAVKRTLSTVVAEVSYQTGYSRSHIYHVINGSRNNKQISKLVKKFSR